MDRSWQNYRLPLHSSWHKPHIVAFDIYWTFAEIFASWNHHWKQYRASTGLPLVLKPFSIRRQVTMMFSLTTTFQLTQTTHSRLRYILNILRDLCQLESSLVVVLGIDRPATRAKATIKRWTGHDRILAKYYVPADTNNILLSSIYIEPSQRFFVSWNHHWQ